MVFALQQEAKDAGHEHPLFIGIDQENGQVTRISPPIAPQLPGPMALGATHSPDLAHAVGRATGETLGVFGINMNYAPVCDVNSEPLNPVIGVRSPGDDPEFVGRFASAAARGLREEKVVPCVKHFPGHGDTAVDSHFSLPVIQKTRDQLERCELMPFRRAVAEGIESIMTAHIALPGIGDQKLPATLSKDVLDILRKEMKYDGMVVTDCMEMDGIRATFGTEQGTVLALNAGCDSVMICHTFSVQVASILKVREAVQSGIIDQSRLDEAYQRVMKLKSKMLSWDRALETDTLSRLHGVNVRSEALAKEAYSQSVTLVRDQNGILPLSGSSKLAFLFPGTKTPAGGAVDGEGTSTPGTYHVDGFSSLLHKHNSAVSVVCYGEDGLSKEQWTLVDAADAVIFFTLNARESPFQQALARSLSGRVRNLMAVAGCNPYDFLEDSTIGTYLATYEPTVAAFEAATNVVFGVSHAKGALPVGRKSTAESFSVAPFEVSRDLQGVVDVWAAALPTYRLSTERLGQFLVQPNGHHFVARVGSAVAGFCLAYTTLNRNVLTGQIAVVAVRPENQRCGVGTALLTEARSFFRTRFGLNTLGLTSCFPRFWPGIPRDLPREVQDFFIHRGFRLNPIEARSVDLYQDIRTFRPPQKYLDRAQEKGYTFCPLIPQHYEECLVAQRRNFSGYPVSEHRDRSTLIVLLGVPFLIIKLGLG